MKVVVFLAFYWVVASDEFCNCGVTPQVDEAYQQSMLILIGKH